MVRGSIRDARHSDRVSVRARITSDKPVAEMVGAVLGIRRYADIGIIVILLSPGRSISFANFSSTLIRHKLPD
jgi:hypothetical protein